MVVVVGCGVVVVVGSIVVVVVVGGMVVVHRPQVVLAVSQSSMPT